MLWDMICLLFNKYDIYCGVMQIYHLLLLKTWIPELNLVIRLGNHHCFLVCRGISLQVSSKVIYFHYFSNTGYPVLADFSLLTYIIFFTCILIFFYYHNNHISIFLTKSYSDLGNGFCVHLKVIKILWLNYMRHMYKINS